MSILDTSVFSLKTFTQADPAVGTDFLFHCPENLRIKLIGLTFQLVTDANVANRNVEIYITDGTNICPTFTAAGLQVASETVIYYWAPGARIYDGTAAGLNMYQPLSDDLFLEPSEYLGSIVTNIQVGDQISDIVYRVQYWPRA